MGLTYRIVGQTIKWALQWASLRTRWVDNNISHNFGITFKENGFAAMETASKAALTWAWAGEDVKMLTVTLLLHVLNVDGYIGLKIIWKKT